MVTEVKAATLPTHDVYPAPANVDVRGTAEAFLAELAEALRGGPEAFARLFIPEGFWRDVLAFTRDFRTIEAGSIAEVAKVSPRPTAPRPLTAGHTRQEQGDGVCAVDRDAAGPREPVPRRHVAPPSLQL